MEDLSRYTCLSLSMCRWVRWEMKTIGVDEDEDEDEDNKGRDHRGGKKTKGKVDQE